MRLIQVAVRSENALPIEPEARNKNINTLIKVIGKTKEKRFNVGAERVIIPPAILINNMPPTTGSIIRLDKYNIFSKARIPELLTSKKFNDAPIGR